MRHLIPFNLSFRMHQRHVPLVERALTGSDINRVFGMAEELRSQWRLESHYLHAQFFALSAGVVGPLLGFLFFDWNGTQLLIFLSADLLFMYLADILLYRLATDQVLEQGLALQRSNYAGGVLAAVFDPGKQRRVPDEPAGEYHDLRMYYLEPIIVLAAFVLPFLAQTLRFSPRAVGDLLVPLSLALVLHLVQAMVEARAARAKGHVRICAVPKANPAMFLYLAIAIAFVPVTFVLHELTGWRQSTLGLTAFAATVALCLAGLGYVWKSLIEKRRSRLEALLGRPREHWIRSRA